MNGWTLLDADGRPYASPAPGALGGHRRTRIYGRLDCPTALRTIARGGYVKERVFFLDEATAQAAGYRPCARCMKEAYREWKTLSGANSFTKQPEGITRPPQRGNCAALGD
ncbi:Ada metal-binding domain-containing protein [Pseudomonas sp. JS3066]|uniref:Ada metal-binding domain-containing protein n=1 Tax=unclassified Pseudomonas TaxID=196821 RepID=UPI0012CC6F50|nr:Ada metal-binding domain-containing protein [Pseudomonas sp. JS3066]MDH4656236.1 metal-binding protein [Pseudomonas sp. BN606]MRK19671.1 metal-binding protein [Pseudomonas sp. JG-B]WVK91411.1 Ada metal-binding domain-containing protein [Pseudomonas sp. JS3066]